MDFSEIFPKGLDITEAYDLLEPVVIYILGMALYAIFVFRFYQFVSSKDIFEFDVSKYEESKYRAVRTLLHVVVYTGKYLVIFPVVAFFWFGAFTVLLSLLAPNRDFSDILLVAMAVVGTIRISAYLTENLSRDLAKILPFAVLGIFIINVSFFNTSETFDVIKQADDNREAILYYLGLLVVLEFALRIMSVLVGRARSLLRRGEVALDPSSPSSTT